MPGWFRQGLSPHQTALAMIGAKPGNAVAVIGAHDPNLAAEIARVTGLNGQATVVDPSAEARERVDTAAGNAGALVEFEQAPFTELPLEAGSCDVVVLLVPLATLGQNDRAAALGEALRVLCPGGRVIVIDGSRRTGMLRALQTKAPRLESNEILTLLDRSGARAHRQLADTDGVAYYEARKSAT